MNFKFSVITKNFHWHNNNFKLIMKKSNKRKVKSLRNSRNLCKFLIHCFYHHMEKSYLSKVCDLFNNQNIFTVPQMRDENKLERILKDWKILLQKNCKRYTISENSLFKTYRYNILV